MNKKVLEDFIQYVSEKLEIDKLPKITISKDPNFAITNRTFGMYDPQGKSLIIETHNRNTVDILRTLGHELVHHRQMEVSSSKSRTELEIEATAAAGMLVKLYCEQHPEIYKIKS